MNNSTNTATITGEEIFATEAKKDMKGAPRPVTLETARYLQATYGIGQGVAMLVAADLTREWGIQNGFLNR